MSTHSWDATRYHFRLTYLSAVLIATLDEHSTQVKQVGLLLMIGMATGCKSSPWVCRLNQLYSRSVIDLAPLIGTMQNSLIAVQSAVEPKDAAVVVSSAGRTAKVEDDLLKAIFFWNSCLYETFGALSVVLWA